MVNSKGSLKIAVALPFLALLLSFQATDRSARKFELIALSPKFWELFDRDAKLIRFAGGFGFTEGPVWDPTGFLYVSDEEQNHIYKLSLDGQKKELISLGDPDGNTYDREHRLIDCASVL